MNTNNINVNGFTENLWKDKLPQTGISIFALMSGLARREKAVNLSQGFPDFDIDPELIRLVNVYMKKGYNQYAPMPGVPELRQAIARKIKNSYNRIIDRETEITVTAGATQALFVLISAWVHPGDEVIVFEPAYDSYVPVIRLNSGKPVYIRLQKPAFSINWDEVENKITSRTRLIIVNTPNNPGGYVFSDKDWKRLEKIAAKYSLAVLSDEVYEHIVFDGLPHRSILQYPELYKQGAAVFSFGKTFHATGWKTGYIVAPPRITALARKIHQFNVFAVNTPVQYALAEYMQNENHYNKLPDFYQEKRDYFINALQGSRWQPVPTHGTYFIALDYSRISDEPDFDFARRLTRDHKVASIPMSFFYHNRFDQQLLRFCFAKRKETLDKALEILSGI